MTQALQEELFRGIDEIAATENHLLEVISKSDKEELKEDLRNKVNELRHIRQDIVEKSKDILFQDGRT